MNLILWRHAQVEPSLLPDWERELSEEGLRNAQHGAHFLNAALPADCQLLVSPAKRAQQTASALQRPFRTVDDLAPGANVADILQAIDWPQLENSDNTVMLVGHQPYLGMVIARLIGKHNALEVPNTIAYWLSNRDESGPCKTYVKGIFGPGGVQWRDEK